MEAKTTPQGVIIAGEFTQMVVGAATHAFVSKEWHLAVDNIDEVPRSLNQSSANVVDAIDTFFGALRVATGISTGYAQILWVPKGWALNYFCDLTPVYGTTIRQYPNDYDDFAWARQGSSVSGEQLKEVRRVYLALIASNSEAVRLAVRRLNGCLTRTDAADAILDGTIGLELLLGDDQNQSLSYKLRLRAGALALLHADPNQRAADVTRKVKRLYEARSSIVHGRRKKSSKKASEPADKSHAKDRAIASDLLRFALDVLLTHPEYQEPAKIDEGLLLRGDLGALPSPSIRKPDDPLIEPLKEIGTGPPEPVVYFAYGSNMATARLRKRMPSCKPLGIATLPGYALRFHKRSKDKSGKCNAFASGNDNKVIGVLFSFDPAERIKLDEAEGVGSGYEHSMVTVINDKGLSRTVLTYLATSDYIDDSLKPYGWYKDFVLAGGREHGLPLEYITKYIQSVEAIEDPNKARDKKERSTFGSPG